MRTIPNRTRTLENTARGRKLKIESDYALCAELKKMIVDKNYSPYGCNYRFQVERLENGNKTL